MDIGEVFIAGGSRPGISRTMRYGMPRLVGLVGRLQGCRVRVWVWLWLWLGGLRLFWRKGWYDRRGLCVARGRLRLLRRRWRHDIGGLLRRLAGPHLRRR